MSSLRVETLRLAWIEAFVAVVEEENISAAGTRLGLSQPTISRHLKDLQVWLGRNLVERGGIRDPDSPRLSIGITEDGRKFYKRAVPVMKGLTAFRTPEARASEQIEAMKTMINKLRADLESEKPSRAVTRAESQFQVLAELVSGLDAGTPLETLGTIGQHMRSFFAAYETELYRERKVRPKKQPGTVDISSLKL